MKNQADSTATGIKVDPYANLNNAFIKANVWLNNSGGTGLTVDGQLKYGIANLRVENLGTGIHITSGSTISSNQSFLLTAINVSNKIINNSNNNHDIITNNP